MSNLYQGPGFDENDIKLVENRLSIDQKRACWTINSYPMTLSRKRSKSRTNSGASRSRSKHKNRNHTTRKGTTVIINKNSKRLTNRDTNVNANSNLNSRLSINDKSNKTILKSTNIYRIEDKSNDKENIQPNKCIRIVNRSDNSAIASLGDVDIVTSGNKLKRQSKQNMSLSKEIDLNELKQNSSQNVTINKTGYIPQMQFDNIRLSINFKTDLLTQRQLS